MVLGEVAGGAETLYVRVGDGFEMPVRGLGFYGLGCGPVTLL